MKTPDDIKFALECASGIPVSCNSCPYKNAADHNCGGESSADALDYIEQLEAKVPKWISVEERVPNQYEDVLAFSNDNELLICHYDGNGWIVSFDGCYNDGDVTHWMYLPQDPRTEE